MVVLAVVSGFLVLSLGLNAFLFFKSKSPKPQQTYDVRELLHDLTLGGALVQIKRVDPNDVFLRSPRESR